MVSFKCNQEAYKDHYCAIGGGNRGDVAQLPYFKGTYMPPMGHGCPLVTGNVSHWRMNEKRGDACHLRAVVSDSRVFHLDSVVFSVNSLHSSRFKSLEVGLQVNNSTVNEIGTVMGIEATWKLCCYLIACQTVRFKCHSAGKGH